MVIDEETVERIEKQAKLYDAKKGRIISKIQGNIGTAIEKLRAAERDLLDEVEIEFGENPFAKLLDSIYSENPPTEAKVKSVLAKGIPKDFGPSEESFFSLCREIEAFKSWRKEEDEDTSGVDGSEGKTNGEKPTQNSSEVAQNVKKWECTWKVCPGNVSSKYAIDPKNPKIAKKVTGGIFGGDCTIIGNTLIPIGTVTSWNVKVLKSWHNDGEAMYIGVAPSDINQNEDLENYKKCGWYLNCEYSKLISGPPHKYKWKEYGPKKGEGKYVHNGDAVGVTMDTAKGELSFALGGVDLGVAYEKVPLDKPLVPCAILGWKDDSIELVF